MSLFSVAGGPVWTVTGLTTAIKTHLEDGFPSVSVEGEVSNCRPSGAGHIYFTLKDAGAVIAAALFRGRSIRAGTVPADGMQVIVTGRLDVYPPRGSYQIIVEEIRPAGRGALLEALERRKNELAAQGLFAVERKKPLPPYPRRVAVVTSPTGAAIRDILQVLERRAAAPRVTVLPTPVQGADAPAKIAAQIRRASAYALGDVVIVARGGGSLEDLMSFNEEIVVRAIAACPLPVICGVGHETDVTLADLAADVRAATPSAAAELVSDRSEDLLVRARGFRRDGGAILLSRIDTARRALRSVEGESLRRLAASRLEESMRRTDEARRDLETSCSERLRALRRRYDLAARSLADASPAAVMERGWARVSRSGRTVVDAAVLDEGDELDIRFARGGAATQVLRVFEQNGEER